MPLLNKFHNIESEEIKNNATNEIEKVKTSFSDVMPCENNFDRMPDEILMLIFDKLRNNEKINLTKVCQRFKNHLITSKTFIRTLKLYFNDETRILTALEVPYSKIAIRKAWKHHVKKRSLRIVKVHKENITKIEVDRGEVMFNIKLLNIVSENLTDLSITFCSMKVDFPYDKTKVNFPNLKVLNVIHSSAFLRHIGDHKIIEMSIEDSEDNQREINEFLTTCESLLNLTLENILPSYNPEVHKYNLEFFWLKFYYQNDPQRMQNFLQPHKKSLKKLKIHGYASSAEKYAINEMNVEELLYYATQNEVNENFKENRSIKKLEIFFKEDEYAMKIIKACKAVENFALYSADVMISHSIVEVISENMKNLKHLKISRMASIIESLHFDKLETLKIKDVKSKDEHKSWISLALCCPNLKKVFITQSIENKYNSGCSFSIASSDLKNLINSSKNLQELHIGPYFDITDEFIETILNSESKSFWYLKIESEDFEEDGERARKFEGTKIRCEVVRSYKSDELEELE